ncbi:hypothetical protein [Anabaena azotica]|uniref:Uncharacterized protein n=1 Tax=Anabaena azotica FACHB-119 TaxID=947527 RepID=A0ABR8DCT7_9NOST|nr:hypothetical protein [Anabaena azotica]MBD2505050.1 hypothetical protein [Anabaena azotica FACHB-119]
MSEPNDIRSILASKSRAKVAPRDTSLNLNRSTENSEASAEIDDELDTQANEKASTTPDLSGLQAELESLPTVGKRLAVHLEKDIRADLLKLCDASDITPEIFIEAAIASLHKQPELMSQIIADAKVRLAQRKRAGLIRRTLVMVQKYGS